MVSESIARGKTLHASTKHHLFLSSYEGKQAIIKIKAHKPRTIIRLENILKNLLPSLSSRREIDQRGKEDFEREAAILRRWENTGILSPHVYYVDSSVMVMEFLSGRSYGELLARSHTSELIHEYMSSFDAIRRAARKTKNNLLLHSDPVPKNFVRTKKGPAAIDPGLNTRSLPFDELDARLCLSAMYGTIFETPDEERADRLNAIAAHFDKDTARAVLAINGESMLLACTYATCREYVAAIVKQRNRMLISAHNPRLDAGNQHLVNTILEHRIRDYT